MNAFFKTSASRAALAAGAFALLAGCDFASRLPDAPTTTLTLPQKPPSVTETTGAEGPNPIFLPDEVPPQASAGVRLDGIEGLEEPPTEVAQAPTGDRLLREQPFDAGPFQAGDIGRTGPVPVARETAQANEGPRPLIAPLGEAPQLDTERLVVAPPETLPPLDRTVPQNLPAPIYDPVGSSGIAVSEQPASRPPRPVSPTLAVAEPRQTGPIYDPVEAEPVRQTATTLGGPVRAADTVSDRGLSPIALLHTRLPNGSVVTIHPVIRAPGPVSVALVSAIGQQLGSRVSGADADRAAARFHLRGVASADPTGGVTWRLLDASGAEVRRISERADGTSWAGLGAQSLEQMAGRAATALKSDAALRRATINSVAKAPRIAPQTAPLPRARKAARAVIAPQQTQQPVARQVAMTPIVDRPQPRLADRVDVAPLSPMPVQPRSVRTTPPQVQPPRQTDQMVDLGPLVDTVAQRQPSRIEAQPLPPIQQFDRRPAPTPAPAQTAAAMPVPTFDTLRPAGQQQTAPQPISGPAPLVFRGVFGAPGDGDTTLTREIGRMLAQSGASLGRDGAPGALYLTGNVSKSSNGSADRIRIVWRVEDAGGGSVGEVVQENDVPLGALDSNWGQDAFYAARGARDGIVQLLQAAGALDT